ncbi:MAG TPA: NADP-dependent malic enzyme [bacterium]|nr:NADP-dependent malic enzyme [bacterium]
MNDMRTRALDYHAKGRAGKIEVVSSKPCQTSQQLSLAYTPGVAVPCLEIEKNKEDVYRYTARGNLVAVISNGTAVLGLGNIGPHAAKPVMEGKGVLFKRFADIDVFDLEVNTTDIDEFVRTVALLEPTFGGINLEDIKAPDCFVIEKRLQEKMDIPVFHDDQHGTAIISAAALVNACELRGTPIGEIKLVVNGAGAAAIACTSLYCKMGLKKENVILCDSRGVVYQGRTEGMNPYKEEWAADTDRRTLAEALAGADAFVGLSVAGAVTPEMLKGMAHDPIVFAMANPDPEIMPDAARQARPDVIMATGRSDFPNQVNNVLGFPFIFRGALDVQARKINDEMKIAAAQALASLAREDVPESVAKAYEGRRFTFGRDYIIPKPFDTRVLLWVAPAVAKAALRTGVARKTEFNCEVYRDNLEKLLGPSQWLMRKVINIAKHESKRIVFAEGESHAVLRAAHQIVEEQFAVPVLLGERRLIEAEAEKVNCDLQGCEIIDPRALPDVDRYAQALFELRQRKGLTLVEAQRWIRANRAYMGALMLRLGEVDGMVYGEQRNYPEAIRPALQVLGRLPGVEVVAGAYMMLFKDRVLFFADCTVNIDPTAQQLAQIAVMTADLAAFFGLTPRLAMLSYSNFGSIRNDHTEKIRQATALVQSQRPELEVDGEMQADTAVNFDILSHSFCFAKLSKAANVLIFPDLMSGNAAYKLLRELGGAVAVGPLLLGINGSFNVLHRGSDPETIMNVAAVTACQAGDIKTLRVVKD